MVPVLVGVTDQVTAVLLVFVTLAVNCSVCPFKMTPVFGLTDTETGGNRVTVAVPVLVVSSWRLAMIVTGCVAAIVAGAEYSPLAVMLPDPLTDARWYRPLPLLPTSALSI